MKTIILSFDDARRDFYTRALPIINQFKLTATLNVTTDFILNPSNYECFQSGDNQSMCTKELIECQNNGIEIACHGHYHLNTKEDVLQNIQTLKEMNLTFPQGIGFASLNSEITSNNKNDKGVWELVENGTLTYIRSGIQVLREGLMYTFLSLLDRYIHSPKLWYLLNKRNIFNKESVGSILPSVTIHSYTSIEQIQNFILKMPDHSTAILMFHSICNTSDKGYGVDKFYFDEGKFIKLCEWIVNYKQVQCSTTIDYVINNRI